MPFLPRGEQTPIRSPVSVTVTAQSEGLPSSHLQRFAHPIGHRPVTAVSLAPPRLCPRRQWIKPDDRGRAMHLGGLRKCKVPQAALFGADRSAASSRPRCGNELSMKTCALWTRSLMCSTEHVEADSRVSHPTHFLTSQRVFNAFLPSHSSYDWPSRAPQRPPDPISLAPL